MNKEEIQERIKYAISNFTDGKEIFLEIIEKLEIERDIANKVIEEMAKWIFDKDYGENSLLIHRDDYYSNCIKQVIQYFKEKVEGK